jgi:DNA-directed RNA polymerase specialized sigma24 family protein
MHAPSDTTLVNLLKAGDRGAAAQEIWQRYFHRLAALARTKLSRGARRVADEEDVALSVLDSFFRGVEKGRFPRLDDRQDLWQILVLLTERKAVNRFRRYGAAKRGGQVAQEPVVSGDASAPNILEQLRGAEPDPEVVALFNDECRRLFAALPEPQLQVVALLRMEGFTCMEIGQKLGRAQRSIERKLRVIRGIWESLMEE